MTPEQLENLMNGGGFWRTKLGVVGDLRKRWPIGWPRDDGATPYQLVEQLGMQEGRPPPVLEQELDRRGWASLLVRERASARPHEATLTGSTETCWNPVQRLHSGCAVWGDYVRPPGWIVRVFDPDAIAGQSCQWSLAGGVIADTDPIQFVGATRRALQAGTTTTAGDCREVRIVVPSVPAEAKAVAGQVTVMRTSPNGSPVSVMVTPRDRLVIGFGNSFTSGEGNPERLALFSGKPWPGGNLPDRAPDPVSLATKDTRAQWTDRWCHRSVYSWQIRTALDAALNDPHQSFTVLPYGCSGATIMDGVLYGYNGVEWRAATDKGVVGSRSEVGLAYQEICQPEACRSYCSSGAPWCGRTKLPNSAAGTGARLLLRGGARPAPRRHALRADEYLQTRRRCAGGRALGHRPARRGAHLRHRARARRAAGHRAGAFARRRRARRVTTPQAAADGADVIIAVTTSRAANPRRDAGQPGVHVSAFGADEPGKVELAASLCKRAKLVVDNRTLALTDGVINVAASAGELDAAAIHAELGEVLSGARAGASVTTRSQSSVPSGWPRQDLVAAELCYRQAVEAGAGRLQSTFESGRETEGRSAGGGRAQTDNCARPPPADLPSLWVLQAFGEVDLALYFAEAERLVRGDRLRVVEERAGGELGERRGAGPTFGGGDELRAAALSSIPASRASSSSTFSDRVGKHRAAPVARARHDRAPDTPAPACPQYTDPKALRRWRPRAVICLSTGPTCGAPSVALACASASR